MSNSIPQTHIDNLLEQVKKELQKKGLPTDVVDSIYSETINPECWEINVPYSKIKAAQIRKPMEDVLYKQCGVDERYCDYYGKQGDTKSFVWFLRHPQTPQEICDKIDAEIEEHLGEEISFGLPIPGNVKSNTDTAFITIRDIFFKQIKEGVKTCEYRNINQYYCDKFFSPGVQKKYIKINNGYLTGEENQMLFEIQDIVFMDEHGNEHPARDNKGNPIYDFNHIAKGFVPACYCIKLGNRIK